jgi:hypothetical protein
MEPIISFSATRSLSNASLFGLKQLLKKDYRHKVLGKKLFCVLQVRLARTSR